MKDALGTSIRLGDKVLLPRPGGGAGVGIVKEFIDPTVVVRMEKEFHENGGARIAFLAELCSPRSLFVLKR